MMYLYATDSVCCTAAIVVNITQGNTVCSKCHQFNPDTKRRLTITIKPSNIRMMSKSCKPSKHPRGE